MLEECQDASLKVIRALSLFIVRARPEVHQRVERRKSWYSLQNRQKILLLLWNSSQKKSHMVDIVLKGQRDDDHW